MSSSASSLRLPGPFGHPAPSAIRGTNPHLARREIDYPRQRGMNGWGETVRVTPRNRWITADCPGRFSFPTPPLGHPLGGVNAEERRSDKIRSTLRSLGGEPFPRNVSSDDRVSRDFSQASSFSPTRTPTVLMIAVRCLRHPASRGVDS